VKAGQVAPLPAVGQTGAPNATARADAGKFPLARLIPTDIKLLVECTKRAPAAFTQGAGPCSGDEVVKDTLVRRFSLIEEWLVVDGAARFLQTKTQDLVGAAQAPSTALAKRGVDRDKSPRRG
jgi:hypothetical protein